MSNVITNPTFFPRRVNEYVPAMQYASDVNFGGDTRVSFGTPKVADSNGILSAQSIATAGSVDASDMLLTEMDANFGRNVTIVASAASTSVVTVEGWDYLGQPMTENITANGTTAKAGLKAFKTLKKISWTATSGATIDVGYGDVLGLPYKAIKAQYETADGAINTTVSGFTAAVLTDPQTATTGDPRGTYDPTTTLDGSKVITAAFVFVNDVNSDNNGGLHGIAHYHA